MAPQRAPCSETPNSSLIPFKALEYRLVLKFMDTCGGTVSSTACSKYETIDKTHLHNEDNTENVPFLPVWIAKAQLVHAILFGDLDLIVVAQLPLLLFVSTDSIYGHGALTVVRVCLALG